MGQISYPEPPRHCIRSFSRSSFVLLFADESWLLEDEEDFLWCCWRKTEALVLYFSVTDLLIGARSIPISKFLVLIGRSKFPNIGRFEEGN